MARGAGHPEPRDGPGSQCKTGRPQPRRLAAAWPGRCESSLGCPLPPLCSLAGRLACPVGCQAAFPAGPPNPAGWHRQRVWGSFPQRRGGRRHQLRQPHLRSGDRLLGDRRAGRAGCWTLLPLLGRRLLGAAATRRALGILYRALLHTRKGAVVSRYPYLLFFSVTRCDTLVTRL